MRGQGAGHLVQSQRGRRIKRAHEINYDLSNTLTLIFFQILVRDLEVFVHITEELLDMAFPKEYISVFFWIRSGWISLTGEHQSSAFSLISFLVSFSNSATLSQGYIMMSRNW